MKLIVLGSLLVLVLVPTAAAAQPPPDVVFVGARAITAGPRVVLGVDGLWQRPQTADLLFELGATTGTDAGRIWGHGHGGLVIGSGATHVQLVGELGSTPTGAAPAPYAKGFGRIDRAVRTGRAGVAAEAMYVRAAQVHVAGLGSGGYLVAAPSTIVRADVRLLTWDGRPTLAGNGRIDYTHGACTFTTGGSAMGGRGAVASLLDPVASSRSVFAGLRMTLGQRDILTTFERTEQGAMWTNVMYVGLRLPVR